MKSRPLCFVIKFAKVAAAILIAIFFVNMVGGAANYFYVTKADSTIAELRSELKEIADVAGAPLGNSEETRKLVEERRVIDGAKQEGKVALYSSDPRIEKT
jgi:hypothetical protein